MSDGSFNIALGRVTEFYNRVTSNDPANAAFVIVLLRANEADDTLNNYDTLDAVLTQAGNTEADFTNYERKILSDADIDPLPAPDDTNNRIRLDLPDQTWTSAGGTTDNTLTKLLICYDPDTTGGDDTTIIPLVHLDFARTTDGGDLPAHFAPEGFYQTNAS